MTEENMSKLEELIEQYCPDGVEYYKIKDVYKRIKGTPITAGKMKEIATPDGSVRIFAGGKTVIDANEKDIPNANITRVPAVLIQSRGVIDAVYYDKPFTFKNEMWAYTTFNQKSVKYLYYILKSNIQTFRDAASGMGALPQISLGVTEEFEIPVPPLPVQEEIVRILDAFTELQAELQAELQKRKQQYNYYLDNLLNFKNINRGGQEIKWMKMSEICIKISSGGTPSRGNSDYFNGDIPWLRTQEVNRNDIYDTEIKITKEAINKSAAKLIPKNCVIIAMYGATAGKTCINKIPLTTNQACCNLQIDANAASYKYVYYCVCNDYEKIKSLGQGSQHNINAQIIKDYIIPVPPLAEQNRIVAILDRFDTLTTDLTQGLPAEIEKRRQQYEFYRDKLLTFKRKEA